MNTRLLPLIGLVLVACTKEATEPKATKFPLLEDGTVRVNVLAEPLASGITVTTLMIDAKSLELGAYQGRFRFDPDVLELIEVTMPEDNYRFVNANRAAEGEIRFAGFTVTEFESPVALVMRFKRKRELRLKDMRAELEVVGDILGEQVKRERILEPAMQIAR